MKRFLLIFLLMALVVVAGDRLIGKVLRNAYEQIDTGEIGRVNYMCHKLHGCDVLIFGSSRALHHYVPSIITDSLALSCYNCGMEGQGIFNNYALMRAVLRHNNPKLIVYELTLDYDAQDSVSYSIDFTYIRRQATLPYCDSLLNLVDAEWRYGKLSSIYPYNSVLARLVMTPDSSQYESHDVDCGYIPQYHQLKPHVPKFQFKKHNFDPWKLHYLMKMCREQKARLVVVTSPRFMAQHNLKQLHAPLARLLAQHDVPYIFMGQDASFNTDFTLWDDEGHLNHKGAQLFTARFLQRLHEVRPSLFKTINSKK
jgi:hypothetical protein